MLQHSSTYSLKDVAKGGRKDGVVILPPPYVAKIEHCGARH